MRLELDKLIFNQARKKIQEHEYYARSVSDENKRRTRRSSTQPSRQDLLRPPHWEFANGFNPYIVRSRSKSIAHSISKRLRDRTYEPMRPASFEVPKGGGETRTVSTFQIADEVISQVALRALLRKNISKFSGHSYAYRNDRNAHHAIEYISREFTQNERVFIAEYDFEKFFDNVSHKFIFESLDRLGITRTPLEEHLIEVFLNSQAAASTAIEYSSPGERRQAGLPQGTSISLFLANLVGTELDDRLERLEVNFVRFADDTLIWSPSYEAVVKSSIELERAAKNIGAPISFTKSEGIRILSRDRAPKSEMRTTDAVKYLGHEIGLDKIRMREEAVKRIQNRVTQLIYSNLLREPFQGTQKESRFGEFDKDYYVYILQLRRYLYGPLSEREIRRYQSGHIAPMSFEGIMSFFPLVNDDSQLLEIDNWIAARTWLGIRKRSRLLSRQGIHTVPPAGLGIGSLGLFQSRSRTTGDVVDLRLPSLRRAANVVRRAISQHGLQIFSDSSPLYIYPGPGGQHVDSGTRSVDNSDVAGGDVQVAGRKA